MAQNIKIQEIKPGVVKIVGEQLMKHGKNKR